MRFHFAILAALAGLSLAVEGTQEKRDTTALEAAPAPELAVRDAAAAPIAVAEDVVDLEVREADPEARSRGKGGKHSSSKGRGGKKKKKSKKSKASKTKHKSSKTSSAQSEETLCSKEGCHKKACAHKPGSKKPAGHGTKKTARDVADTAINLLKRVPEAIEDGVNQVHDLVKRGGHKLSGREIVALYSGNVRGQDIRPQPETGVANDATYDRFGSRGFYRTIGPLSGCTVIVVASKTGVWVAHYWEKPYFVRESDFQKYVIKPIDARHGHISGFTAVNEPGQVPSDAFTGSDTVVAVITPEGGRRGWAARHEGDGKEKYKSHIDDILAELKAAGVNRAAARYPHVKAYHALLQLEEQLYTTVSGKVVIQYDGTKVRIYAEDTILYSFTVR